MKVNLAINLIALGLIGFTCGALGFLFGKNIGYKDGCAETIEMYEYFRSDDHDLEKILKNQKILDMFTGKE